MVQEKKRKADNTLSWILCLLLCPLSARIQAAIPTPDPISSAAEYYFTRHDYRQAFQLWTDIFSRQPDNLVALLRVSELQLMFEGREASRDSLLRYLESKSLPAESKHLVTEKLVRLQSLFLSDDGQSTYLQAIAKIHRKDCQGALPLLDIANRLEKGNLKVLHEKATCEKSLGLIDKFYLSEKVAYEMDPFDSEVLENLAELHAYHGEYAKVIQIARRDPDAFQTNRQKTALGLALLETGSASEAFSILQKMAEQEKRIGVHPTVLFALGKILSEKINSSMEATNYLERFLESTTRIENCYIDGWDPYHCTERADTARKLLQSLNAPNRN